MRVPTKLNPCVITQGYHEKHHAIDLRAYGDENVYAPEDCIVDRVFVDPKGNHAVYLTGKASKISYRLFHVAATVLPHMSVSEGSVVGVIILDPGSTGTHLHFEVLKAEGFQDGVRQNPIKWLRDNKLEYKWKKGIPKQGEINEEG